MRSRWAFALAAAAAVLFAVTTAFEGIAAHGTSERLAQTDTALLAMASSHFGHTTLTSDPGIVAKSIYSRDGAWCYIVAEGVPSGAHVVVRRGATVRDLGALAPGEPATLFVRAPGQVDEVTIADGGHVLAHGRPVY